MARPTIGRQTRLLASILLAAAGALVLAGYVRNLENKAEDRNQLVEVFVAKETIPLGTPAETASGRNLIGKTSVARKLVVEGAITSLTDIRGRVAAAAIFKGEQITVGRFVAPSRAGTLPIPADRQAMSVEVDTPPGVAGFVQPGDRVSVVADIEITRGSIREKVVKYVIQDVPVLAVGSRVVTTEDGQQRRTATRDKVLLTLALTPEQVERLAFALLEGEVYFTLLPPNQKPIRTTGRTSANVLP